MNDAQFRQILDRFEYSWAGYRRVRKGVKKRLARHIQEIRCRNIKDYIEAIEENPETRLNFECLMTVSISRFFRDRGLWNIIRDRILPNLIQDPSQAIRVWFAGCASGEEVYSFKILCEKSQTTHSRFPDIHILATDMCPEYLSRAQIAVYPRSSMREVPETIRNNYFEESARGKYQLKPGIKDGIVWQIHDLLSDPPDTVFDLIFLRNNLLTYYIDPIKIPAVKRIVDSLNPGGFLIIGSHEKMPTEISDLKPFRESTIMRKYGQTILR
jgi:chemotaxis protein methyltransferase CheR